MSTIDFVEEFGPRALVTGASSGIGASFARELARAKLDLTLVARRADRLHALADELTGAHGVQVEVIQADLADAAAPARLLQATENADIGLVVSNAGFGFNGAHERMDPEGLTELLMVNCHAPLQLTRGFIPRLRARRRGGIVLTASVEGLLGGPYSAAYAASKAFVISLGEGLWGELTPDGIKVVTLCPGATDTEAMAKQGIDPKKIEKLKSPDEVAALTIANLGNGPTFFSDERYKQKYDVLLEKPRREALSMMAQAMKSLP